MATFHQVQAQPFALSGAGAVAGATSIVLKSFAQINGTLLTMADFGSVGYLTMEPGNGTLEEQVSFTGVVQNSNGTATLSGIKTVLDVSPYTETSGLAQTHAGSTTVVLSNTAGFYNQFPAKANDETITGQWTFNTFPITPSNSDASTTVKGVAKLSVAPAVAANPIAVGTNDTRVPTADPTTLFAAITSVPSGVMFPYGAASAPTGFLLCDGSAVSRATYAALFAVVGTSYGVGDGSTTFNVPESRGRSVVGAGTGTKVATFASRSSNVITVTGLTNAANNEFQTGQVVNYVSSGAVITGLTTATNYFVIRTGNLTFSLATTLANAQNGVVIALSSDGTGTQTFTLTLTTRTLGNTGGEENHAMSSTEILAHTHTYPTSNSGGGSSGFTPITANISPLASSSVGGNVAMNDMSPFFVTSWIIKI